MKYEGKVYGKISGEFIELEPDENGGRIEELEGANLILAEEVGAASRTNNGLIITLFATIGYGFFITGVLLFTIIKIIL